MSSESFISSNGRLVNSSDPVLTAANRSFRYGDGLFEAIRVFYGKPFRIEEHITRLLKGMQLLQIDIPGNFNSFFSSEIGKVCNANRINAGGRVRLTAFRNEGGLFSPSTDEPSFIIEAHALPDNSFILNKTGLAIDIFEDYKKPCNELSKVKSNNCLLFVLAAIHARKNSLHDCLLLNENNHICEATSSNVFICKGKEIITPAPGQGCVEGTMKSLIINLAKETGYTVTEKAVSIKETSEADEVFLTNAIEGIKWVSSFRDKKYSSKISLALMDRLNACLKN